MNSKSHDREELLEAVKRTLSTSIAAVGVSGAMQMCQVLVQCTTSNRLVYMVHAH